MSSFGLPGTDGVEIHSWTGDGELRRGLNLTWGAESQDFIYIVGPISSKTFERLKMSR